MVRDIYIIRHGNAYDEDFGKIDDVYRNLNVDGINEALEIGRCMEENNISFDVIYSSSASRALQTAVIVARTIGHNMKKVEVRNDLYLASVKTLINTIRSAKNSCKSIAIFSHNPGVSDLAWRKNQPITVSTCGVVHYKVNVEDLKDVNLDVLEFHGYGCPEEFKI